MRRFLLTFLRVAIFLGVGCFVTSCRTGSKHVATDVPGASTNQTSDAEAELHLGQATAIPGTNAIRMALYLYSNDRQSSFSSRGSYNGETRNILFIERGEKAARWLIQDNDHLVGDVTDVSDDKDTQHRVLASLS